MDVPTDGLNVPHKIKETQQMIPIKETKRVIRSYIMRSRGMTAEKNALLHELWPQYGLELEQGILVFKDIFHNDHPVVLEIGFGMGESLLNIAQANPDINYIGVEVHRPGLVNIIKKIQESSINNLRVFSVDAIAVLNTSIADHSLSRIQLFFPDPWPKLRHHKRRLVQPATVALMAKKLMPTGLLHFATDWEDYAQHMLKVCLQEAQLKNCAIDQTFVIRPSERPLTKFEQRGLRLGHGVRDLMFSRRSD